MASQPKLKVEVKTTDRWIEMLAFLLLAANIGMAFFAYFKLPETIPTHFNLKGDVDAYGGKASIFIAPAIGFVLYLGMTWLNFYPEIFNYPVKITSENAARQYRKAVQLVRWLKVIVILTFFLITWSMFNSAVESSNQLQVWIILSVVILPLLLMAVYLNQATKQKNK